VINLFFIFTVLVSIEAFSAAAPVVDKSKDRKPIFFQAEKNNLQVLPQKFEYLLIDSEKIRLGDILIDSSQIRFQILFPKETKDYFRIRFSWPAGLFPVGQVVLFNNYGKSIWSAPIDAQKTKIIKGVNPDFAQLRNNLAEYTSDNIEKSIFEDMKFLPFMKFCVSRTDRNTRIDLCSRELFLSSKDGQLTIKIRETNKRQAQITINEKELKGDQGIIFLNDPKESVAFRAIAESGATLEIETRVKAVDFRDVTLLDDKKTFQLMASGARPVESDQILKLEDDLWKKQVPVERPLVYLLGEGDIPMKQEFFIRGELPDERFRPYIEKSSPEKTYQGSVNIKGFAAASTKIYQIDKNSKIENGRGENFNWTLSDLAPGTMNKRYLGVETGKGKYQASHQVFRGLNKSLGVSARYDIAAQAASSNIELDWWFENFLFIESSFTRFRWGIAIANTLPLASKAGALKLSSTDLELKYRFNQGLHLIDPGFGLSLGLSQLKATVNSSDFSLSASGSIFKLGGYYFGLNHHVFPSFFDWWQSSVKFSPGGSLGASLKSSTQIEIKNSAIALIKKRHLLIAGITVSQAKYTLDSLTLDPAPTTTLNFDTEASKLQISPEIEYQFRF
jgi:hypothetical protein